MAGTPDDQDRPVECPVCNGGQRNVAKSGPCMCCGGAGDISQTKAQALASIRSDLSTRIAVSEEAYARAEALPRLQQTAGAAYTLHQVAAKALQGASGDPKAVNWAQVHQDVFAKAVGQDKQPVPMVLDAIKLHSPGAVTSEQIAAVDAMGEPKKSVETPVHQSPISKILRELANERWPMDESQPQDQTQAWAGECSLFVDAAWRPLEQAGVVFDDEGMVGKFSQLSCDLTPPPGLSMLAVTKLGIEKHINHHWLVSDGRHFDASSPDGVESIFDLRSIRQTAAEVLQRGHPKLLQTLCNDHAWWRDSVQMLLDFRTMRAAAETQQSKFNDSSICGPN